MAVAAAQKASVPGHDLLVVGPGVLGSRLGVLWKERHPDARIVGQTNSTDSHERLSSLGFEVRTKDEAGSEKFPFVACAAPPSGSSDYPATVAGATALWDGSGSFVFTSSGGVYSQTEGACAEDSPVKGMGESERSDRLLGAESAALEAGGNVVRFVGLYHGSRGAHTTFLRMGQVDRSPDAVMNLIHYEDAASLTAAILDGDGNADAHYRKQVFLGSDNVPLTYSRMMELCSQSGVYEGECSFTGTAGAGGKETDNSKTRQQLRWQPRYGSFEDFVVQSNGKDWYNP